MSRAKISSECDAIGCTQVKDWDNGSDLTAQRLLAYTAMVNINNYLYNIYFSLSDSGTIGGLVSGHIVTVRLVTTVRTIENLLI